MSRRQGSGHWAAQAALATLLSEWRTEDCPLQVQVAPCAMCSTWAQPWLYSPWALPTNKLTFSGQPWAGLLLVTGKILHLPSTTTSTSTSQAEKVGCQLFVWRWFLVPGVLYHSFSYHLLCSSYI